MVVELHARAGDLEHVATATRELRARVRRDELDQRGRREGRLRLAPSRRGGRTPPREIHLPGVERATVDAMRPRPLARAAAPQAWLRAGIGLPRSRRRSYVRSPLATSASRLSLHAATAGIIPASLMGHPATFRTRTLGASETSRRPHPRALQGPGRCAAVQTPTEEPTRRRDRYTLGQWGEIGVFLDERDFLLATRASSRPLPRLELTRA